MKTVQLREAKAKLSSLVTDAAQGQNALITRHGKPQAVILGIDEWNRLRDIPSFGHLLTSAPLDDEDLPARNSTPLREPKF